MSTRGNRSLEHRIAAQRARLADAKKRVRARLVNNSKKLSFDSSPYRRKDGPGKGKKEVHELIGGIKYNAVEHAGMVRMKSPQKKNRKTRNTATTKFSSQRRERNEPTSPRRGTYFGTYSQKEADFLRERERTRRTKTSYFEDSDDTDDSEAPLQNRRESRENGPFGLLTSDEEDFDENLPYEKDAEENLDTINDRISKAISDVSKNNSTELVSVRESSQEAQRLQTALTTRQLQLDSAREEVLYTGNLVEMLRQTIDNKEKEKKAYEAKFVQLEQKNLKFEAQINSLEQELETRGESYRLLQQDYDNVTKEFDRSTGENRVNRIAIEQTQLEMELTIKNQRSKIESLENSLDESRDLHQKTQLRLKDAVKNLSNDATVRIELNTKLGSLENDMDALKRDKQSTENVLSSTSKELEKVKAELLEANNSLRLCKEQLKDRDADCLMRTKRAEVSTKQAMEELSTTKDELSLSFQRQESLAKQVKDLEAKLNAKPDIETIEKHEYDKLQERCHALKAELDGVTQLLLAKDSLISKLRGDVVDAEAFVRSKRQNFARRDSIAARQAASLSAQLQAANARIDAMNETLSAKDIELNGLKKRLDSSDASLEQGRDEKSKYLKSYEEVLSQKKIIDEQLKQTREELEAKLYIIQQLNQRLATLESEITTSENDQRERHVQSVRRASKLEADVMTREAQLGNLKRQLHESKADNEKTKKKLKEVQDSVKKHKEAYMEISREYSNQDIELTRYKTTSNQLEKQIAALKKSKDDAAVFNHQRDQELEICRTELNHVKSRNEQLQDDHDAIKRAKNMVSAELATMKAKCKDFERQLDSLKMELKECDVLKQKHESDMEGMKVEVERYKGVRDDARMHMDRLRKTSEATTALVQSLQNELSDARTIIERLEAKSESQPVLTKVPQPQVEEPDLVVTVEVGDGVSFDIEISNDDNVENVAKRFVAEHGLDDDAIPALVAYIEEQLSVANFEENVEDNGEDDQVQEQSLPQKNSKRPNRKAPQKPTNANVVESPPPSDPPPIQQTQKAKRNKQKIEREVQPPPPSQSLPSPKPVQAVQWPNSKKKADKSISKARNLPPPPAPKSLVSPKSAGGIQWPKRKNEVIKPASKPGNSLPPPPVPPMPRLSQDAGSIGWPQKKASGGTPTFEQMHLSPPPIPPPVGVAFSPPPPPKTPNADTRKVMQTHSQDRRKARMRRISQLLEKQKDT